MGNEPGKDQQGQLKPVRVIGGVEFARGTEPMLAAQHPIARIPMDANGSYVMPGHVRQLGGAQFLHDVLGQINPEDADWIVFGELQHRSYEELSRNGQLGGRSEGDYHPLNADGDAESFLTWYIHQAVTELNIPLPKLYDSVWDGLVHITSQQPVVRLEMPDDAPTVVDIPVLPKKHSANQAYPGKLPLDKLPGGPGNS